MKMPRTKYFDLTGLRFGELLVLEREGQVGKPLVKWSCLCDCGNKSVVATTNLRNGSTKSCGCRRRLICSIKAKTHGLTNTPEYKTWAGMRTRCTNPKATNYGVYGERGIKCCERWNSFENFLSDMGKREKGKTLDRIDVDGDYEPKNCRWATKEEQVKNKRQCKLVNKFRLLKFLKTQTYITKEQQQMIAKNFFKNSHK